MIATHNQRKKFIELELILCTANENKIKFIEDKFFKLLDSVLKKEKINFISRVKGV